jgi:hypothetical protein
LLIGLYAVSPIKNISMVLKWVCVPRSNKLRRSQPPLLARGTSQFHRQSYSYVKDVNVCLA